MQGAAAEGSPEDLQFSGNSEGSAGRGPEVQIVRRRPQQADLGIRRAHLPVVLVPGGQLNFQVLGWEEHQFAEQGVRVPVSKIVQQRGAEEAERPVVAERIPVDGEALVPDLGAERDPGGSARQFANCAGQDEIQCGQLGVAAIDLFRKNPTEQFRIVVMRIAG